MLDRVSETSIQQEVKQVDEESTSSKFETADSPAFSDYGEKHLLQVEQQVQRA